MIAKIIKIAIFGIILFFTFAEINKMSVWNYFTVIGKSVFGLQTGTRMYKGSSVENFGKVDNNIYRGSRPDKAAYTYLKNNIGVKTILDLTDDPKDWCVERADKLGLNYINIPMSDKDYPEETTVKRLESTVLDEELYPIFIHCQGGRHRTGVVVGIYRVHNYGWDFDSIYKEMKQYDFYTEFGHALMKKFIFDYAEKNKK